MITSATTDTVRPQDRADYWADLVSRYVTPVHIEPDSERRIHGEVETRTVADFGIAKVSGAGLHARHTRSEVARTDTHVMAACVHLDGEALFTRRGERVRLRTGDVFITDSRQEFTLDLDKPWRHLVITLPTHWIDGRVSRPECAAGAVLRDDPLVGLWARNLTSGFALAGELTSAAAALFVRHSVELLCQVLEEGYNEHPTPSEAWRSATFLAACEVIALKYSDPHLTPDEIARDVNVSTRTLQRIFAANAQTIMGRVFDERVRRAARFLTAPKSAHRSVTEISGACGFADLSHFGRVFAARMGLPPSDWRRRNQ